MSRSEPGASARRWIARTGFRPRLLGLAAALALFAVVAPGPVLAHPVRVGRYTELPYGIRPDHPYPTARGGNRRTGRVMGSAPRAAPTLQWQHGLSHHRPRGPIVSATGTLYVGTLGGVTALRPDGSELWSVALGGAVHAPPSLAPSDEVIAVTRGGLVAALTPEGVVRARADLGAPARGSPLVLDDGSILVGTIDRRVHRLDTNLRRVFSTELSDGTAGTLSVVRRGVLAVPAGGILTLLSVDGGLLRQVSLGGRATAPAAIADDGTIWVPTVEGVLHAIDPSGRSRSRTELGSRHYDGAAIAIGHDGAVRVPTMSQGVVCVGPGGTERWRYTGAPNGFNAPASVDAEDVTLVTDRAGRMIAIEPDGTERWQVPLGTFSFQAPVIAADGTVYVATERGQVQAWR